MNISQPNSDWPITRFLWIGLVSIAITFGGVGGWIMTANVTGAIITPGRLEIIQLPQIIQHPTGGVVQKLLIREGDIVGPGDTLIMLETAQVQSDLNIIEYKLFEVIARQARLRAEMSTGEELFAADTLLDAGNDARLAAILQEQRQMLAAGAELHLQTIRGLQNRAIQIHRQISGLKAQKLAVENQQSLLSEQLSLQNTLVDRGLAPVTTILNLKRNLQMLSAQTGSLTAELGRLAERLLEIDISILKAQAARKNNAITSLQELEYQEVQLTERQRVLEREFEGYKLTTPIAGTVLGLKPLSPKSVIRAGETLLTVVPDTRSYAIRTRIKPSDIDQVTPGQTARIRFSLSSPVVDMTSDFSGTVKTVSADTLIDPQTGAAYFDVEIEFSATQLPTENDPLAPTPGMPVEVFFRTENQPVWAYLAKPLRIYFSRAFRES